MMIYKKYHKSKIFFVQLYFVDMEIFKKKSIDFFKKNIKYIEHYKQNSE